MHAFTRPQIRRFMAEEGAGGAGGGSGEPGATGGAQGAQGGAGGAGEPDPAGAANPDAYTRALETMKAERAAARAEAKAFKDLGLSLEEIQALKAARDEAQGGPTPEQIAERARQDAEKAASDRYADKARASAVREQATALGFHNPRAALALLDQGALAEVEVADDEADPAGVKALLEALAKAEPYLVKAPGYSDPRDAGIGAVGGGAKPDPGPGANRIRAAYAEHAEAARTR